MSFDTPLVWNISLANKIWPKIPWIFLDFGVIHSSRARNYPKHSQIQDTLGGSAARDLTQAACGHGAYGPEIFMILGQTPPFSSNDEVTAIVAIGIWKIHESTIWVYVFLIESIGIIQSKKVVTSIFILQNLASTSWHLELKGDVATLPPKKGYLCEKKLQYIKSILSILVGCLAHFISFIGSTFGQTVADPQRPRTPMLALRVEEPHLQRKRRCKSIKNWLQGLTWQEIFMGNFSSYL